MVLSGEELLLPDVEAWHAWLDEHHTDVPAVWLVLSRKGGTTTSLAYADAVEEALCFGWIDGQTRRRDDQTTFQRWTPRGPRSRWSSINVGKAERLIAEGRMQPAGLAAIEAAQADGRWEAAYDGSATAVMPPELLEAIAKVPAAQATYDSLDAQNRYALYHRLSALTTEAGRAKRIESFVAMLAEGRGPHSR